MEIKINFVKKISVVFYRDLTNDIEVVVALSGS